MGKSGDSSSGKGVVESGAQQSDEALGRRRESKPGDHPGRTDKGGKSMVGADRIEQLFEGIEQDGVVGVCQGA